MPGIIGEGENLGEPGRTWIVLTLLEKSLHNGLSASVTNLAIVLLSHHAAISI